MDIFQIAPSLVLDNYLALICIPQKCHRPKSYPYPHICLNIAKGTTDPGVDCSNQ